MLNIYFIRVKAINRNILFTITKIRLKPVINTPSYAVIFKFFCQNAVVDSVKIFLEVNEDTNS